MEDSYLDIDDGFVKAKDQMTWLLNRVRKSKPKILAHSIDH